MKRELKRQRTLQLILDTTKAAVEELGCSNVTIRDILDRSGLSRGAVFHYVKNKEQLLALVLEERLKQINQQFEQKAQEEPQEFMAAFQAIVSRIDQLLDPKEVTNQIIIYLLSRAHVAEARESLNTFYQLSVSLAKYWIESGQTHGLIPVSVPLEKTANLFVTLSFGLRMRGMVQNNGSSTDTDAREFIDFFLNTLQPAK